MTRTFATGTKLGLKAIRLQSSEVQPCQATFFCGGFLGGHLFDGR